MAPALSTDGRYLAYVHRRDQVSELVLHEIETRRERVLVPRVERDRQDYVVYHLAAYPTMAWMPDGESLLLWYGGGIPADARVFDLAGRTVMPGIVDVHAHYLGTIAPTRVIEQRVAPPSRSPYWSGRRRRTCVREHSAMFERPGVSPENRCNVR